METRPEHRSGSTPQPTGTVTFLLSDVEGSTQLWQSSAERALAALTRLEELVAQHADDYSGYLQREPGEGVSAIVAFASATDAVSCVLALQKAIVDEPWDEAALIKARMALHTGEVEVVDGSYRGLEIHSCARVRGLAYDGQTFLSERTSRLVRASLPAGVSLREMGSSRCGGSSCRSGCTSSAIRICATSSHRCASTPRHCHRGRARVEPRLPGARAARGGRPRRAAGDVAGFRASRRSSNGSTGRW